MDLVHHSRNWTSHTNRLANEIFKYFEYNAQFNLETRKAGRRRKCCFCLWSCILIVLAYISHVIQFIVFRFVCTSTGRHRHNVHTMGVFKVLCIHCLIHVKYPPKFIIARLLITQGRCKFCVNRMHCIELWLYPNRLIIYMGE